MKISIDVDGTLKEHLEFFITFMKTFIDAGHEVGIMTGRGSDANILLSKMVLEKGLPQPMFILTSSLYNNDERNMIGKELNNEVIVGHFKARMMIEKNIDVHFDDKSSYIREWLRKWEQDVPKHIVFTSPTKKHIKS